MLSSVDSFFFALGLLNKDSDHTAVTESKSRPSIKEIVLLRNIALSLCWPTDSLWNDLDLCCQFCLLSKAIKHMMVHHPPSSTLDSTMSIGLNRCLRERKKELSSFSVPFARSDTSSFAPDKPMQIGYIRSLQHQRTTYKEIGLSFYCRNVRHLIRAYSKRVSPSGSGHL